MPERSCLIAKAAQPISFNLRRSPRLLHTQNTHPKTPNTTTPNNNRVHPVFSSSSPTSSRPRSRFRDMVDDDYIPPKDSSRNCKNISATGSRRASRLNSSKLNLSDSTKGLKEFKGGSNNCGKSANGSRTASRLNSRVEGTEGLRRSSRFRNQVNSLVNDVHMARKGDFDDGSIHGGSKSKMGSRQLNVLGIDSMALSNFDSSPITPIGIGEKKFREGLIGKETYIETSSSPGQVSVDSGGRILRSCSRQVGGKVGYGKTEQNKQNVSHSFKGCNRVPKKRVAARPDGQVRGIRGEMGKESESVSCKSVVCGLQIFSGDSPEKYVGNSERMITRSASKRMGVRKDLCELGERQSTRTSSRHVVTKAASTKSKKPNKEGSASFKCVRSDPQKRITRSLASSFSAMLDKEAGIRKTDGKNNEGHDCGRQDIGKLGKVTVNALVLSNSPTGERKTRDDISKDSKLIGAKRTRKQARHQGTYQGWTKEQEVALQRAYFTAKPSPHIWKKVAKLVPGKSAQECFDKVHSDNMTPPAARPSSRAKRRNSLSDMPLSGNDLFKSPVKSKKTGKSKRKSHMARKTARHLLQKYCHVNQDSEADLFSVLEPEVNSSAEALQLNAVQSTPQCLLGSPGSSSKCRERSSSNHKKRVFRLSGARESPLTSPPVLKKVKNMALHEKYIDQLHIREAKRKLASTRYLKSVVCQKDGKENPAAMKDVIKAAKNALVSDARDVINKFRHSQVNIMEAFSDSEEGLSNDEEEEETDL